MTVSADAPPREELSLQLPLSERQSASQSDARIVIVVRPTGWRPRGELDVPAEAVVWELVRKKVHDATTFIRQFNAASLKEGGRCWAGLTAEAARPGRAASLLPLHGTDSEA